MYLRICFLIAMVVGSLTLATAQNSTNEIKNLEKVIAHLNEVETNQKKLFVGLDRGSIVMVRFNSFHEPIPFRTEQFREEFVTGFMMSHVNLPASGGQDLFKMANEAANKLIAECKLDSREKLRKLNDEISQGRTQRKVMEKRLAKLKSQTRSASGVGTGFGGTWRTDWGKMVLTQSGNHVSGTYEHADGKIDGEFGSDGVLNFKWTQSNGHGIGMFKLGPDGNTFKGTWNYTDDNGKVGSGGGWTATRM